MNLAKNILAKGGLNLTKLMSNNTEMQDYMNVTNKEESNILGVTLNLINDFFSFEQYDFSILSLKLTKRTFLALLAKPFDPLGFLSPFIMYAKIIMQLIWLEGLDWDDELPETIKINIYKWIQSTKHFSGWCIPRMYFPDIGWDNISNIEVHGFCDASMKGYGTVVYVRIFANDKYHVSFVAAKGRATPVQRITLPRLELMSALLCARLVDSVVTELEFKSKNKTFKCFYWTDSSVAYHWIKSDAYKLKMFVANRVSAIQSLCSPFEWHHCPGTSNPADILSRGSISWSQYNRRTKHWCLLYGIRIA